MFRSLQWRIAVPYMALIVVGAAALSLYLIGFVKDTYMIDLESRLRGEAVLIAEVVAPYLGGQQDADAIPSVAGRLGARLNTRVTVIGRDGTVLGDSGVEPRTTGNQGEWPEVRAALLGVVGQTAVRQDRMLLAVPVEREGRVVGAVRVSLPLSEVNAGVRYITTVVALATGLITLLSLVAAAFIARATTGAVKQVTAAAHAVASGELGHRITVGSRDEMGQLAQAFNEMSASLRDMLDTIYQERNQLAAVLAAMADGMVMTDAEGRVLLSNRAAEELFGFDEEKASGLPLIEVVRDHEINGAMQQCLETGQPQSLQVETRPDRRFLRVMATPLFDGGVSGALLVMQDLTELRQLQSMRQEFIGNISHELRTPLASIKVLAETLQDAVRDDPAVVKGFLSRIEGEVESMAQLVEELVELSRIETGRAKLELEEVDLSLLAQEVEAAMEPQARRKGVGLGVEPAPDLPPARADAGKVRRVLTNLVHNAIKFTPAGGTVTVSAGVEEGMVVVRVTDTGIGIPSAELSRVFERFYKVDKSRSGEGTGLGLAIAKHVVQAHGGTIWAESQEGKGSTFAFTLSQARS
ncbi:MAG: ATP-binding protein [Dehalococcoidia bacterium]